MSDKLKKQLILNLPYILIGLYATKLGEAWRLAEGADASQKFLHLMDGFTAAFQSPLPSFHLSDLLIGLVIGCVLRLLVYEKSRNAKKYRRNEEYGSARWGTHSDIAPFIDPDPWNNVILTKTESLTMSSRPKDPRNARNKNVLVVGGSGSGKTRFFIKPNIMQCTKTKGTSIVVTDPKGTLMVETGKLLVAAGYDVRAFNTINFSKSMHYNPFAYIHSEKDILKLVTVLIANTKGEGKAGEDFWVKAETLLYISLIGYIHYELPPEKQNFSTLIDMMCGRMILITKTRLIRILKSSQKRIRITLPSGSMPNIGWPPAKRRSRFWSPAARAWQYSIFRSCGILPPMMSCTLIRLVKSAQRCF